MATTPRKGPASGFDQGFVALPSRSFLERSVSILLVDPVGGRRPHRRCDAIRFFEGLRMAAARAGSVGRGCGALSDGGRKGQADGGSRGARGTGAAACRTHAPRRGNGTAQDQPRTARRGRPVATLYPVAN